MLHDAIRVFRASGYPDGRALAGIYLGRALLGQDDLDGAEAALTSARDEFEIVGVAGGVLEASVHLAECHVRRGEPAAALELIDLAITRVDGNAGVLEAAVARVSAAALARAGRVHEADEQLAAGLEAARRQQLPYEEMLLLDLRDQLDVLI
jgi:tetratricopeptide (TPR) repeat protein